MIKKILISSLLVVVTQPLDAIFSVPKIFRKASQEKKVANIKVISLYGEIASAQPVCKQLLEAAKDPNINGILLLVDSGGGDMGSSDSLHHCIAELSKQMPVIAYVESRCLSGAYLAASAATCIVAPEGSSIGSIGVYIPLERWKNIHVNHKDSKADAEIELIYAGDEKIDLHYLGNNVTQEIKDRIQRDINEAYEIFCNKIARARNLDLDARDLWANGRKHTGITAKTLGLIDQLGGHMDAIDLLLSLLQEKQSKTFDDYQLI